MEWIIIGEAPKKSLALMMLVDLFGKRSITVFEKFKESFFSNVS